MTSKELIASFRRVLNHPTLSEEKVCEIIYDLAMRSYFRGDFRRLK